MAKKVTRPSSNTIMFEESNVRDKISEVQFATIFLQVKIKF